MEKTTPVSQLIINKLTKAQYDALTFKDPYQLYMVTDGVAAGVTVGTWVSTARTDIPYGMLRADGKHYSEELSGGDVSLVYNKANFPNIWEALENGTLQSVGTYSFEKALEKNGWCGVFGFGKEEVTQKYYSFTLYWLLSETPKTGDRAYDAQGNATDRTARVESDGTVTFVQDVTGGTAGAFPRTPDNDYSITQIVGRDDVFFMPKVTNHAQQNVMPELDGSNKNLGRTLVAEQIPTAENLYSWYKLYSDGWVEQGGYITAQTNSATVTLPIQMANAYYLLNMGESDNIDSSTDTDGGDMCTCASNYTNTTFRVSKAAARDPNWTVRGYANTAKIPGFRAQTDNFLIQAYNANQEVKVADFNAQVQSYVDDSVVPEINNVAADWLKDITYKMGSLVQTNKTVTPKGLLKLDGKNTDGTITYSKNNFPDLYNAIKDGTIRAIPETYFLQLVEENGWCGVFGLQEASAAYDITFYCWVDGSANKIYTLERDPGASEQFYSEPNPNSLTSYTRYVTQIDGFSLHEFGDGIFTHADGGDETYTVPAKEDAFYVPKISNTAQYGIQPDGNSANKHLGRVLIKTQEPTADNKYTWYNLYNDGWVEQGSMVTVSSTAGAANEVKFPVEMRDTSYSAVGARVVRVTSGTGYQTTVGFSVYTTTSMKVHCGTASVSVAWQVCGYSSQVKQMPDYYVVAYSENEEPSIADYNAILTEHVDMNLKPALDTYTNNEIEKLNQQSANWTKDITYKMGNLVQSTRTDLPLGLIKADGKNTDGETIYTPTNYPDLYDAIVDGKIQSVDIVTFNSLVEKNGWCGVFGLQTANTAEGRIACFYAPKITNVHQYGVIPATNGSNKHLGRTLIKTQEPTAENNYTWYNLYNDGWVEQGGRYSVSTSSAASAYTATEEITLPIGIEIGTGCGYVQAKHDCFNVGYSVDPRTCSTTVKLYYKNALGSAYTLNYMDWFLSGYAFESPEQLPNYYIVAYSNSTEVTIGNYNAMLEEYKEETIKPDIYNYAEGLKPSLQNYVNLAQIWAISDEVVDVDDDLYSAKKYAERAADVAQCYYQPIRRVNLNKNATTTVNISSHPITVCSDAGGDLVGGNTYTISLSMDKTTGENDCWTYEIHLPIGNAIPTINWQTTDGRIIRWMAYSPKTPQLTNATAMFVIRNQGGLLIANYSGAY